MVVPPAVPQVVQAAPPPGQYGFVGELQTAVLTVPLSPLQGAQAKLPVSQTFTPVQLTAFAAVHSRHSPVPPPAVGSQTSLRHWPLLPAALPLVHGPSPFAWPQRWSASQVPLLQRLERPLAQRPPAGMALPVLALAWQRLVPVLHHCVELQSASTLQPPAGRQVPLSEHAPLRHTVAALLVVQAPVPLA